MLSAEAETTPPVEAWADRKTNKKEFEKFRRKTPMKKYIELRIQDAIENSATE